MAPVGDGLICSVSGQLAAAVLRARLQWGRLMAETILQLCITVILLVGLAAFLLLCFQATGDFLRDLVSRKTVRTVLRSAKRFRLRTLLGLTAVAQIFVAIVVWETKRPGALPVCLAALGCIFFVLWMIWACLFDTVDSLKFSSLRRFGKSRRITVPSANDRESKPDCRDVSSSQSQKTLCRHLKRSLTWPVLEESGDSAPHSTSCGKRTNE